MVTGTNIEQPSIAWHRSSRSPAPCRTVWPRISTSWACMSLARFFSQEIPPVEGWSYREFFTAIRKTPTDMFEASSSPSAIEDYLCRPVRC